MHFHSLYIMSNYYAKFLENPCVGTDASTPFNCIIWASTRDNLSSGFAKNKGADRPAHPFILISAFVIRLLESIISRLATGNASSF